MKTDAAIYKRAELLRRKGNSYASISTQLGISKSTVSSWFADQLWSMEIKANLNNSRLKIASKNLSAANLARAEIQKRRRERFIREARTEFERFVDNPLFLVGLGVYWGEGDKTSNGRVAVINTDPNLLQVVGNFYRRYLGVSESMLRIGLFIYENDDREAAMLFWSDKLRVPVSQFIKVQILKSRSRLTKNKLLYGICSLYCSSTELSIKIHEWIRLMSIHQLEEAGIV